MRFFGGRERSREEQAAADKYNQEEARLKERGIEYAEAMSTIAGIDVTSDPESLVDCRGALQIIKSYTRSKGSEVRNGQQLPRVEIRYLQDRPEIWQRLLANLEEYVKRGADESLRDLAYTALAAISKSFDAILYLNDEQMRRELQGLNYDPTDPATVLTAPPRQEQREPRAEQEEQPTPSSHQHEITPDQPRPQFKFIPASAQNPDVASLQSRQTAEGGQTSESTPKTELRKPSSVYDTIFHDYLPQAVAMKLRGVYERSKYITLSPDMELSALITDTRNLIANGDATEKACAGRMLREIFTDIDEGAELFSAEKDQTRADALKQYVKDLWESHGKAEYEKYKQLTG